MKTSSKLFIAEQTQWVRCRLRMRVAGMNIPIMIAAILLSVSSLSAQSAPSVASAPDLTPALGGIPKAPTPVEIDKPAKAVSPAESKVGRVYAILGQWHGSLYSGSEFSVAKIYSADRWSQFWLEHLNREQPADFDESLHQAVYIELGVRPTGGYRVEVVRVYEEDKHLVFEYVEREPTSDQYVTQALNTPWVMVLLPRTDLRVITREAANK